jgi:O-antigen ligase
MSSAPNRRIRTVNLPFLGLVVMVVLIPLEELTTFVAGRTLIWSLGVGVLATWLSRTLVTRTSFRVALWPTVLVGAWTFWGFASVLWAHDTGVALGAALRLTQFFAFFILIQAVVKTNRQLELLVWAMLGTAVVVSLAGIGMALSGDIRRLTLTEVQNPNWFARALGLGFLMSPYLLHVARRHHWKVWLGALTIVVAIFLTGSRGAWLALAAALGFGWVVSCGRFIRLRWVLTAGILIVVSVLGLHSAGLIDNWTIERAVSMFDIEATRGGTGRLSIWAVGWELVRDNQVVGVGIGNFSVRFGDYIDVAGLRGAPYIRPGRDPHNLFLSVQGELGVPGLAILFGLLWVLFRRLWALRFNARAWLGLLILAFAVASGLTATWHYAKSFWVALAIAAVVPVLKKGEP